jgi:hypothetical protein
MYRSQSRCRGQSRNISSNPVQIQNPSQSRSRSPTPEIPTVSCAAHDKDRMNENEVEYTTFQEPIQWECGGRDFGCLVTKQTRNEILQHERNCEDYKDAVAAEKEEERKRFIAWNKARHKKVNSWCPRCFQCGRRGGKKRTKKRRKHIKKKKTKKRTKKTKKRTKRIKKRTKKKTKRKK